jgi:TonB-linked SusC/RagA family outer membrane protein
MRRVLTLLVLIVLGGFSLNAQTLRTITGTVVGTNGNGVPFASITLNNTAAGATADADGKFSVKAKTGDKITASAVGKETGSITLGSESNVTITLQTKNNEEAAVIVTGAMGIKKDAAKQVASAQVLTAAQVNTTKQANLTNALAGKVVGTQARSQSGAKLNDATSLRVRGGSSLSGDRGAIFVVDGTIVSAFDINPEDVESMTVLKGANATVLFGDRAANGAVVITTRKKAGKKKITVELNQTTSLETVSVLPRYQNKYGGGNGDWRTFIYQPGMPAEWQALNGQKFHDYTDDGSWGPRIDGSQHIPWYAWIPGTQYTGKTTAFNAQPSNVNDFWQTGVTSNTNLSVFQNLNKGTARYTLNNTFIKGLLPNTKSTRQTVGVSLSYEVLKNLTLSTDLNYTMNTINGDFSDGYSNNATGSFSSWFHRDLDFKKMKELANLRTPIGTLASWNPRTNPTSFSSTNPANFWKANYWYNPYAFFNNVDYNTDRKRLFGNVRAAYKLTKDLTLNATVRNNTLNTDVRNITKSILESSALQSGYLADLTVADQKYKEFNYEFVANYRKTIKKISFDGLLGANVLDIKTWNKTASTDGGLIVPDVYELTNSVQPVVRNLQPKNGGPLTHTQNRAWFAQVDASFKKYFNVSGAFRQDAYSILPAGNNDLLSYSYGAGFTFSEFTKEKLPWLNYGKVFASIGQKPLAPGLGFGATDDRFLNSGTYLSYSPNTIYWNNDTTTGTPNNGISGSISGIVVKTNEYGVNLKMAKNRVGLNVVYYDELIDNEPVAVAQSGISGFTSTTKNAGIIQRRGIETELMLHLIKKKNFDWNMNFNFAKLLNNDVIDTDGNPNTTDNSFLLAGGAFGTRYARAFQVESKAASQLIGGGILRNEAGLPIVKADGTFATDALKNWGSTIPTVTGGLFNDFKYGAFTATIGIDYQFGGKFFSLSESWGTFSGLLDWTATVNDRGQEVRSPISAGGGVRVKGVSITDNKTPVDMYIDAQTYFQQFYNNQIAEPFVHSLSFVKLREISLGYQLPISKWNVKWLTGASVNLLSRNTLLLYRESKNFDPSEISNTFGEDGNLPASRTTGISLKFTF